MRIPQDYTVFFTGECSLNVSFGNLINTELNKMIQVICSSLKRESRDYIVDIIPAYSCFAVYFDLRRVREVSGETPATEFIRGEITRFLSGTFAEYVPSGKEFSIPVCYEDGFAPDLHIISSINQISREEIIRLHVDRSYHVFMLGFLPGFAYMGEVDERIAAPRKLQPSKKIETGSIGIAGRQTGIYPLTSPGGWQIIGRTPLPIFFPHQEDPALLNLGDRVRFYSITKDEFEDIKSRHT